MSEAFLSGEDKKLVVAYNKRILSKRGMNKRYRERAGEVEALKDKLKESWEGCGDGKWTEACHQACRSTYEENGMDKEPYLL